MGDLKLIVQSKQPLILDLLKKDQVLIKNLKPAISFSEEMRYLEYHLKPAFIKTDTFLSFNNPLPTKYSILKEDYLKLNLNISTNLSLEILMNHHSFNYRWLIDFPNEIEVLEEKMEFELQSKDRAYFP